MGKKSRRQGKRNKKRAQKRRKAPQEMWMTAAFVNGVETSAHPIDPKDQPSLQSYIQAHAMLPWDFNPVKDPTAFQKGTEALEVIGDQQASDPDLLLAIMMLGHMPSGAALEALQRHAASDRPFANIAKMAAMECADWIGWTRSPQEIQPPQELPN